ncbi:hypothetical protein [Flaviaesturariibacter amylovorans]|uniref:Uncharacterized protein n=1 Tax=Flaviaesturariibacter amylovorans TaxID=1084520 RepID=A0ABP8H0R2_9BACT
MGLQIVIDYNQQPVTYDVTAQEQDIYRLCLSDATPRGAHYIPSKINIRRKGKVWVSDLENYNELVNALLVELTRFSARA